MFIKKNLDWVLIITAGVLLTIEFLFEMFGEIVFLKTWGLAISVVILLLILLPGVMLLARRIRPKKPGLAKALVIVTIVYTSLAAVGAVTNLML